MTQVESLKANEPSCSDRNPVPYNDRLAERIHRILADKEGFTERRMFGGIAFMLNGNMCCGMINDYLILRLGSEEAQRAPRKRVRPDRQAH
ncbi:MAG: TfoX/Sxy family protein [Thaumarchaeota archaeon]|nr:TfoX/Sxy family protein [Nitrososphaerota archaeon]